jgi:hypothetical protein
LADNLVGLVLGGHGWLFSLVILAEGDAKTITRTKGAA